MGTMLQGSDPTLDDFEQHEGCNEVLNVTRPDVVRAVHDAYFAAGVDASRPTPSGPTWRNLGEYDISDRSASSPGPPPGSPGRPPTLVAPPTSRASCSAASGPGTKLPYAWARGVRPLRDAYQEQVAAMVGGGVDAVLIETAQDLLQAKAAVVGRRARPRGRR